MTASEHEPAPAQPEQERPRPAKPRPAYGEYAPEGWEWKPEGSESEAEAAPTKARAGGSAPLPGVPHNLGAPTSAPVTPATPATSGSGAAKRPDGEPEPYRAAPPQAPGIAPVTPPPAQPRAQAPASAPRPRTADRVITIILLALGAFGALISAQSMMGMSPSFSLMGDMLQIPDFTVPDWVRTVGTVSALCFIALYAVVLIFSIQRMRRGKIAFWVPLAAGAVAFVALLVIVNVVMANIPEIAQVVENDPNGAFNKMLEYVSTMQQP